MKTLYSLEEFVDQSNQRLAALGLAPTVTVRQVRDYASKNKMSAPRKEGREARYDDSHVEEVLALRHAKSIGISSRGLEAVKQFMSSTPEDTSAFASSNSLSASGAFLSQGLVLGSASSPALSGAVGPIGAVASAGLSEPIRSFMSAAAAGATAGASAGTTAGATQEGDAKSRALSFLSNLDKTSPPKAYREAQASSLISGAAGLVSSTYGSALRGNSSQQGAVAATSTQDIEIQKRIKQHLTKSAFAAEVWSTWEFMPGVRLQVRSDVLEKWDGKTQADLIEAIKEIPKKSK